jgi:hypothetical protein
MENRILEEFKMIVNILIPYRPLSHGGLQTPATELRQLPDGRWNDIDGEYRYGREHRYAKEDEPAIAIKFLNKNSQFKHHIIVIIDNDVYPNDTFLKEYDNVTVLKSKYVPTGDLSTLAVSRLNAALVEGINSVPDDDWLCYSYISDLICGKDWDKYVIEAIRQYGDNYVYVPMFTEARGGYSGQMVLRGVDPTPELVWNEWRKTICCHALTMPEPAKGYFTEEDIDYFIQRANEAGKGIIIERPGDRIYGYYAVMFMKAKHAKKAMRMIGPGFDTDFDNRLYSVCNLMKVVVTNSFVFHPFCEFKSEDNDGKN